MAQKAQNKKQTPAKNNEAANDSNTSEEAVIVDTHLEAVQQLLKSGKERGYVTHDELNSALPQGELTSEQIEDVMAELNELGVNVVDSAESDETEEARKKSLRAMSAMMHGVPMTLSACICAKWGQSSCSRVKVRSPLPSALRQAVS